MIIERTVEDVNVDFTATLTEETLALSEVSFVQDKGFNFVFPAFELDLVGDSEHEVVYQLYLLTNGEVYVNRTVLYSFEDLQASFYSDRNLLHHLGTVSLKPSQEPSVSLYKLVKGEVSYED